MEIKKVVFNCNLPDNVKNAVTMEDIVKRLDGELTEAGNGDPDSGVLDVEDVLRVLGDLYSSPTDGGFSVGYEDENGKYHSIVTR